MVVQQHVLNWLYSVLTSEYRDVNRAYNDVAQALSAYPSLAPRTDVHTFDNGTSALLVRLSGTVPVVFRGTTYRFPVDLWIPHAYPREPPLAYVVPTDQMLVRPGQHVDPQGRIYHPYLAGWVEFWDVSVLFLSPPPPRETSDPKPRPSRANAPNLTRNPPYSTSSPSSGTFSPKSRPSSPASSPDQLRLPPGHPRRHRLRCPHYRPNCQGRRPLFRAPRLPRSTGRRHRRPKGATHPKLCPASPSTPKMDLHSPRCRTNCNDSSNSSMAHNHRRITDTRATPAPLRCHRKRTSPTTSNPIARLLAIHTPRNSSSSNPPIKPPHNSNKAAPLSASKAAFHPSIPGPL